MLTLYLRQKTTFFQEHITNKVSGFLSQDDWDVFVSALILRHIGQLISNGHAIVDFRQNIFTTDALKLMLLKDQANGGGLHLLLKSQRVFTGIFPRISMLNHSCEPNIRNVFDGKRLTIYAANNINEGCEIFNCYGPNWKLMSFQERQDSLRLQYNFECKCLKCDQKNDEYVSILLTIFTVIYELISCFS
jgi:SET domain